MMLILCSCNNKDSQHRQQGMLLNKDTVTNMSTSPFVEVIERGVEEFIRYVAELELGTPLKEKVFALYFYNKDGDTYVMMFAAPYYMKEMIKGYTYIDGCTFVYYGEESVGDKYIDKNKLLPYHDTLPGFSDYDELPVGHYDSYGIEFQIVNSDSLLIVRKGML